MASDSWFRFYNTAIDHPKAMMLSDVNFRAWVTLLCLASKLGGVIPNELELPAMTLRKSIGKTADIIQVLLSAELLDRVEGGYQPHNWTTRQFKSDVSTERVKRFRNGGGNGNETPHSTEAEPKAKKKSKPPAPSALFETFWNECPKKIGRGLAEKKFEIALKTVSAENLIEAMRRYAASVKGKDEQYTAYPATWLNQKRWMDELPAAPAPMDPTQLAEAMDRRDRLLKLGKYAPDFGGKAA